MTEFAASAGERQEEGEEEEGSEGYDEEGDDEDEEEAPIEEEDFSFLAAVFLLFFLREVEQLDYCLSVLL